MAISLRARVVFPVDQPPIEHGIVTIERERIVAVGRDADGQTPVDLGDVALLPGLVNAHTHLDLSNVRCPLGRPGIRLPDWIRLVIAERGRGDRSNGAAVQAGLAECLRGGVCCVGDIRAAQSSMNEEDADDRDVIRPDIDLTQFAEVIGFSRARAASALSAVEERLRSIYSAPRLRAGISPHSPYTVSSELVRSLVELARRHAMPMAMHLAESVDEIEFLKSGKGPFAELLDERGMWDEAVVGTPKRALDYMRVLARAPRVLVIHGNYLDREEISFLAQHSETMSLVYCPRTHAYFSHPRYPLHELLSSGVRVALGTDSRASSPDLDLLSEMAYVVRAHAEVDPEVVLRMATLDGAKALGKDESIGSITPGKIANLAAIRLTDHSGGGARDLLAAALEQPGSACGAWLAGRPADERSYQG